MKSSNNVIAWAMRNFRITFLIIGCLFLFGIYALARIPKQEFPEYTIRQGVVVGLYPGATSEEVEQQLARPLEQFLMTYKEVERHKATSTSQNGMCYVMVELNDDVNNKDEVWSKIKHGLVSFKAQLPAGVVALVAAITIPPVDVHLHRGDVSVRHPAQHGDAGRSDRRAGNDRRQFDRRTDGCRRRLPLPDAACRRSGKVRHVVRRLFVAPLPDELCPADRRKKLCAVYRQLSADLQRGVNAMWKTAEIRSVIDNELRLPQGVATEVGGAREFNEENLPPIICGLAISLVIMAAMSLCLFGAMVGLWIAGFTIGLTSLLGFITLLGMIVRNVILMYQHTEDKRKTCHWSARLAACDAGKRRMVPIFLTTATTAVGVVPMMFGGSSFWAPVGVTIFAGGIGSLILVVTILPVLYSKIYK